MKFNGKKLKIMVCLFMEGVEVNGLGPLSVIVKSLQMFRIVLCNDVSDSSGCDLPIHLINPPIEVFPAIKLINNYKQIPLAFPLINRINLPKA